MVRGAYRYHRRSIRLLGFDYASAGGYFVTLVTHGRQSLFGSIVDGRLRATEIGRIAESEWQTTSSVRREIALGDFVLMPNHLHAVVFIHPSDAGSGPDPTLQVGNGRRRSGPTQRSLGALIGGYKSVVTKRAVALGMPAHSIWQRNYYEHVIRDEADLSKICAYIADNPARWSEDAENPDCDQGRPPVAPT